MATIGNALRYNFTPEEALNVLYRNGLMNDSDPGYLQTIIDQSLLFGENVPFWMECFTLDGKEQVADLSDLKANPAWTVRSFKQRMVPMATAVAPLAEGTQLDNEGYTEKTGSMHQYTSGTFQTSMGKQELEAKLQNLNIQDRTIIGGFVKDVSDMARAHNSRLSNMAAQTLSKGGAYSNSGQGLAGVMANQNAYIPLANFKKAGKQAWTDSVAGSECDIPEQMRKIENDFKEAKGLAEDFPMQWDIPYSMAVNVLLKNPKFIAEVNRYIRFYAPDKVQVITVGANGSSTSATDSSIITLNQLVQYSQTTEISKISPIHIVQEKQTYADGKNYPIARGWDAGKAVLRPAGMAGVIVHAVPKDIAMFQSGEVNNSVELNIATVEGFLYLVNKVTVNGLFKSYSSDVLGCYATVLNEIDYHVVVDTTTKD